MGESTILKFGCGIDVASAGGVVVVGGNTGGTIEIGLIKIQGAMSIGSQRPFESNTARTEPVNPGAHGTVMAMLAKVRGSGGLTAVLMFVAAQAL